MSTLTTAIRTLLGATTLGLAATSAHAVLEVPSNTLTFNFYADCLDCSINAPEGAPAAVLVLENYVPGDALSMDNFGEHFVSFSYAGSDIVAGFSLTKTTYDWGWGPEVGVDFTVYRPEGVESRATSVSYFSGALGVNDGPYDFLIDWDDGLRFTSSASPFGDGSNWYMCSVGTEGGYYRGTCSHLFNQDYGIGQWNSPSAVPEPATWALVGLGLAVVGVSVRRR